MLVKESYCRPAAPRTDQRVYKPAGLKVRLDSFGGFKLGAMGQEWEAGLGPFDSKPVCVCVCVCVCSSTGCP